MVKISYSNLKDKLAKRKDSIIGLRRSSPIHDSLEDCEHYSPYGSVETYGQALEIAGRIVAQQIKEAEIGKEIKKPEVDASKASSHARGFHRDQYNVEEHLIAQKMDISSKGIPEQEMKKISKSDDPFFALKLMKEPEEN